MKKTLLFFLCIIFILPLIGCGALKSLQAVPTVAGHTAEYALPAGSSLPSAGTRADATVPASAPAAHAFRSADWGQTRDDVTAAEGEPDQTDGSRILYNNRTVFGRLCSLYFDFTDGALSAAGYDFTQGNANPDNLLPVYNAVTAGITELYGSPASGGTVWNNSTFLNQSDTYGVAVLLGDLEYTTSWAAAQSFVVCRMYAATDGSVVIDAAWTPAQTAASPSASPSASESAASASPSASAASASPAASGSADASPAETASESPSDESLATAAVQTAFPSGSASPSEPAVDSFRNTAWGMTQEQVAASEGRSGSLSGGVLTYGGQTFAGMECSLFYAFQNGMLAAGGYNISASSRTDGLQKYGSAVAALAEQYGAPATSGRIGSGGVYRSIWNTDTASIRCALYTYGQDGKTAVTVSFSDPYGAVSNADALPAYTFRSTSWGMSMYQVIALEGRQPDARGDGYLLYKKEKYLGSDCHVLYQFGSDGLQSGSYLVYNIHTNPDGYIQDYNTAVSSLSHSLGQPSASQIWKNGKAGSAGGTAVLRGDLSLTSTWNTSRANVSCTLSLQGSLVALDITWTNPLSR